MHLKRPIQPGQKTNMAKPAEESPSALLTPGSWAFAGVRAAVWVKENKRVDTTVCFHGGSMIWELENRNFEERKRTKGGQKII